MSTVSFKNQHDCLIYVKNYPNMEHKMEKNLEARTNIPPTHQIMLDKQKHKSDKANQICKSSIEKLHRITKTPIRNKIFAEN